MNLFSKKYVSFFLLIFIPIQTIGQEADSTDTEGGGMFFYPFAFYTPETKFAIGGGGIIYFRNKLDKKSLPSKIIPVVYVTTNKQYSIGLNSELFFASNKFFTVIELDFGKYSREYYGIGGNTPDIDKPKYNEKKAQATVAVYKNVNSFTRLGVQYEVEYHNLYDKLENPYLIDEFTYGSKGGLTSGVGFAAIYDTRDNAFYPTTGGFYEVTCTYFNKSFGSDYDFNRYLFNFRRYLSFLGNKVIAIQAYGNFISAYPPFYELAELGGQEIMRGYFEGRFRDKKYFAFQAEFRTKLFWRFGFVAFFGFGDVAGRYLDLKLPKLKYSYGIGGRFTIDKKEKLDVRIDIGFGKDTNGLYFGIEQAF